MERKSPQMNQLVDRISEIFKGTQYPEYALSKARETIRESSVGSEEKQYMQRMVGDFVQAFIESRENPPDPAKLRQEELENERIRQKLLEARRMRNGFRTAKRMQEERQRRKRRK